MAYGYEKGFTIERVHKEKRKLSCSDCVYYDKSDKSCGKSLSRDRGISQKGLCHESS